MPPEFYGLMAILIILLILAIILIVIYIRYKIKQPKFGTVSVITGAVKTGKTMLAVYCAVKAHKRATRVWKIQCVLYPILGKEKPEQPLLYSNIPLAVPHVRITLNQLLRQERFAYKSVILLSEASLVADSQMIRDQDINDQLLLFYKLIAHELHGTSVFVETQSIMDNHYSVKRVTNSYLYIDRTIKILPFFCIMKVIENRYSEDGTVLAVDTDDIQDRCKTMIVPKRVWKLYDRYTYSIFTDNLPCNDKVIECAETLKSFDLISFNKRRADLARHPTRTKEVARAASRTCEGKSGQGDATNK